MKYLHNYKIKKKFFNDKSDMPYKRGSSKYSAISFLRKMNKII